MEASYAGADGEWRVNVRSRGRALLMLFLFSDVGDLDAPTLLRVGSHLDVAPLLAPFGDDGLAWATLCERADEASGSRRVTAATGSLGDVYLCHPFLVHRGQAHRGTQPRFMAQPPLEPSELFDVECRVPSAVQHAIAELPQLGRDERDCLQIDQSISRRSAATCSRRAFRPALVSPIHVVRRPPGRPCGCARSRHRLAPRRVWTAPSH